MDILSGAGVAVITPFTTQGIIDYPALEKLINYLIVNGTDYFVVLGTTGESATLTLDEKKAVFAFFAEKVNGRIPLIAGHGSNNTLALIEEIKDFNTEGYSAILSSSPHYNKPTQEGIYQHYKALAEISPLPLVLYNVPSRTGTSISAETTTRLAHDFANIIGTKEASGNFDQFNQIMRDKPAAFKMVSGDDPVTLPMMALGATGIISVIGNALPKKISELVNFILKNDFISAQKINSKVVDFTRLMFAEGNPAGVKSALKSLNICSDTLRLPLTPVSPQLAEKIKAELIKQTGLE